MDYQLKMLVELKIPSLLLNIDLFQRVCYKHFKDFWSWVHKYNFSP